MRERDAQGTPTHSKEEEAPEAACPRILVRRAPPLSAGQLPLSGELERGAARAENAHATPTQSEGAEVPWAAILVRRVPPFSAAQRQRPLLSGERHPLFPLSGPCNYGAAPSGLEITGVPRS